MNRPPAPDAPRPAAHGLADGVPRGAPRVAARGTAASARWLSLAALLATGVVLVSRRARCWLGAAHAPDRRSFASARWGRARPGRDRSRPDHPRHALLHALHGGENGEEKYYALLTAMVGRLPARLRGRSVQPVGLVRGDGITSYMLVAFYCQQKGALEAGVKYLVQSAVGSMLVLLGIAWCSARPAPRVRSNPARGHGAAAVVLLAGALFVIASA